MQLKLARLQSICECIISRIYTVQLTERKRPRLSDVILKAEVHQEINSTLVEGWMDELHS